MPQKRIKILEGIRQGKIGGGESYLLSLVENLDRQLFEPVVVSFTGGPMVERLQQQGIKTYVVHTERPFDITVWGKIKKVIKAEAIDIVHAHGTRAASNLFWAAKKTGRPLLYTCHAWSFHPDQNPLVHKIRVQSEAFLTRQAAVNICGAQANRETGRRLFKNFDAEIIHNSIDPQRFNPNGVFKNIRSELKIGADEILVASIARFTLQKQPLKLIAAFAAVRKTVPNLRLLMVGDGEQKAEAIQLIKSLGIEQSVILENFRQDVPDVLAACDIFVLPSLWEAFPIALLEAMSMGKAVIATAVDGTPEMVTPGENGILIEVENLEENLVQAISRLAGDSSLRRKLQQGAIKSIYNKYNVDTLARKNEAIYRLLSP